VLLRRPLLALCVACLAGTIAVSALSFWCDFGFSRGPDMLVADRGFVGLSIGKDRFPGRVQAFAYRQHYYGCTDFVDALLDGVPVHTFVPTYTNMWRDAQFTVPLWIPGVGFALPLWLARRRARRRKRAGCCGGCGYDLTGNVTGRCSECGLAFARQGARPGQAAPRQPRTSPSLTRRIVAVLTLGASLVLIVAGLKSFRYEIFVEVGQTCARTRTRAQYHVLGLRIYSRTTEDRESVLTAFLCPDSSAGDTSWSCWGYTVRDWRGHTVRRSHEDGIAYLMGETHFCSENVSLVAKLVPDLPALIRRDMLHASSSAVASGLMYLLTEMCADPSKEEVNEVLEGWQWVTAHPEAYAD
jgi:hypothetical protein